MRKYLLASISTAVGIPDTAQVNESLSLADNRFISEYAAAVFLDISPRTLIRRRVEGTGPPFARLGRRIVYDRNELVAWAKRHTHVSAADELAAESAA